MKKSISILVLLCSIIIISCAENKSKESQSLQNTEANISKDGSVTAVSAKTENITLMDATSEMVDYSKTRTTTLATVNFSNSYNYVAGIDEKIEDESKEVFLFSSEDMGTNELASVKFNIPQNCNRISGKSWRCCGTVIVNWDGSMSAKIHTSSNRWQGFTGAIRIIFYDSNQNAIYEVHTPSYGVNGESSRWSNWNAQLDDWVIQSSSYAYAEGIHTSTNRTGYFIYDLGKKYLEQYKNQ